MTTLHAHNPGWSKSLLCAVLWAPRRSLYYASKKRDKTALKESIQAVAGAWPRYGSERVTAPLKREGVTFHGTPVGKRRVRRLLREMGLLAKPRPRRVRTTNSDHAFPRFENRVKNLAVTRPNEVWVCDITYIATNIVLESGFVYLAVVMDVFTRACKLACAPFAAGFSRRLDTDLTLTALKRALEVGTPQIHHSDQGVQYAATAYVTLLESRGVAVSMAAVGCPEENGYAERLMRTIKEEHVSLSQYADLADARAQVGRFLGDVYQTKRIHSSLGYLTPTEFEAAYRQEAQ